MKNKSLYFLVITLIIGALAAVFILIQETSFNISGPGASLKKPETLKVKVFFNNSNLDPEFSCNKVFSAQRQVPKNQSVARAALEELLKGPTANEKNQGFFTSINPGVKIQRLVVENNIAKVDFDEQLEYQMGGSCRVAAIRAQIAGTLEQFPTVKEVLISVNGRTEDILQP